MKTRINGRGRAQGAAATLLLVGGILFVLGFACNSGSKPLPPEYVGVWTATDGSTITLRADATGDYKSGGTSVSGGAVEIEGNTMTIKLVGLGPSFKIDKPPANGQMTLDGMVYRKAGGAATSDDDDTSSKKTAATGDVPSEDEVQELTKQTLLDFNDAVQSGDFTEFHGTLSKPFQKEASAEKLGGVFHEFVESRVDFSDVRDLDARFSSAPSMVKSAGYDMLKVEGYYPTKPRKTNFKLMYIDENGTWKLASININTKDQ